MRTSVQAFRALTAAPADGAATRARVLARTGRTGWRRGSWRRVATLVLAITGVSISASAAWTALAPAWRSAPTIVVSDELDQGARPARRWRSDACPILTIPPAAPDVAVEGATPAPAVGDADTEAQAYARAHRAHFVDQSPARALAAWNQYLRHYPRGALAPEAQFNRALCLIRLGRFGEATRALRAFAASHSDGYRKADVERLLAWLHDREPS
jgi:tetratricopeptide (TPR) repeat protein